MPRPRIVLQINGADVDPSAIFCFAAPVRDGEDQLTGLTVQPPAAPELLPIIMARLVETSTLNIPQDCIPTLRAFAIAVLNSLGVSPYGQPDETPLKQNH